jgi:hypothetical protein
MKEFNSEEYGKMCAEFLGYEISENKECFKTPNKNGWVNLNIFYTDWNWIMEVVEKIESLEKIKGENETTIYRFDICNKIVKIDSCNDETVWTKQKTKKDAVVQAIWEFLNWYKENKK